MEADNNYQLVCEDHAEMNLTPEKETFFDILKLPEEVMVEIFKYLQVRDRKSVKLVCKQFNEAFKDISLADSEQFYCSKLYSIQETLAAFMTYKQKIYNIEFFDGNLIDSSTLFWKNLGPQLRNLRFVYCVMEKEVFEEIVCECQNLLSLYWKAGFLPFDGSVLDNLEEKKIVRKNLRYLEIYVNRKNWISSALLCSIFRIFPAIKKLTVHFSKEQLDTFYSCLNDIRTHRSDIFEKLEVRIHSSPLHDKGTSLDVMKDIFSSTIITEIPRLKYMQSNVSKSCELILNAKYLKVGRFYTKDADTTNFMMFVSKLLDSCPNLRYLDLYGKNESQINQELFGKILKSSLETLLLRFRSPLYPSSVDLDLLTLPNNSTLRSLCIRKAPKCGKYNLRPFMEKFLNLDHLALFCVSDETLQSLFQYQTNLKSLELHLGKFCTRNGFIQPNNPKENSSNSIFYSINRLTKLEYLKMSIKLQNKIQYDIFDTFELTKLRYLELVFRDYDDENCAPLFAFIQRLPALDSLSVCNVHTSYKKWISLCSNCKVLRFFEIVDHTMQLSIKESQCRKFFKRCPSLRVFKYNADEVEAYFDILKKEVVFKNVRKGLTTEKFSPFNCHFLGAERPELDFIDSDSDSYSDSDAYDTDSDYENYLYDYVSDYELEGISFHYNYDSDYGFDDFGNENSYYEYFRACEED